RACAAGGMAGAPCRGPARVSPSRPALRDALLPGALRWPGAKRSRAPSPSSRPRPGETKPESRPAEKAQVGSEVLPPQEADVLARHRADEEQLADRGVARLLGAQNLLEHVRGEIVVVDDAPDRRLRAPHDLEEIEVEELVAVDGRMALRTV